MLVDQIYNKDCVKMDEVSNDSVDLIISGPPYWDYIDYESYVDNNKKDFVWVKDTSYQSFLERLSQWHQECYRVLRPGRYCIINLGTVRKNRKCYPIPFHAVPIMENIGFDFRFDIIWHKVSGGRMHARNILQRPFPGYYTPNNRTEYLLVFQKESGVSFATNRATYFTNDNIITINDYFKRELANNVWYIMPPCYPLNGKHPCPFPPEIPYRLIQLFSLKEETVLDPFMGIGTTARAAKALGRHYIGYETQQHFIDIAVAEMDKPLHFRKPVEWFYK